MMEAHVLQCGPFRVDLRNECVWHGVQALRLRPKSFAVLRYLVTHPGRLVTKEELLAAVWPETIVHEAALTICIGQLRRLLGDTPQAPQFIATVPRRGYRFIAALTLADLPVAQPDATTAASIRPLASPPTGCSTPLLVGREREVHGRARARGAAPARLACAGMARGATGGVRDRKARYRQDGGGGGFCGQPGR